MTRTLTICSSLALPLFAGSALAADGGGRERIVRPEGYIEFAPDDGGEAPGTLSVSPPIQSTVEPSDAVPETAMPPEPEPTYVPPPPQRTAREVCQPIAERFAMRLAELRGGSDGGALDPAVQRAMFGRVALQSRPGTPNENVPEATWDAELKELRQTYKKCLKAERRR